jgi:hypothetical protein
MKTWKVTCAGSFILGRGIYLFDDETKFSSTHSTVPCNSTDLCVGIQLIYSNIASSSMPFGVFIIKQQDIRETN